MSLLKSKLREIVKHRVSFYFISPFFVMYLLFMVIPIIYSLYLSLFRMRGVSREPIFLGLQNYIDLIDDPKFLQALQNVLSYTALQVSLMMILAITLALMLNIKEIRFKNLFRLIYFLPVITSLAVASLIFRMILDERMGIVNILLGYIGIASIRWLRDPNVALISIIIMATWRWVGYQVVILLAGLQNIPKEFYEAATVDGAGRFRSVVSITLPLLFPVIFFCVVMSVIGSLQLFAEPYIMTQGGPADSTMTIALYQYLTGFRFFKMGYASAMAYALTVLILIVSLIQMKVFGRKAGFGTTR